MGLRRLVVSDWGAIKDRVEALVAGLDLEMPGTGGEGAAAIVDAVRSGRIDRSLVERSVARLAQLADRTSAGAWSDSDFDVDAHHALARRAAAASVVLLRNETRRCRSPPVRRWPSSASSPSTPQFQGGGSSHVNPTRLDVPLDELRAALGEENVTYARGYAKRSDADPEALLEEAAATAASADVAVIFVGLYEEDQSEGFDRETSTCPRRTSPSSRRSPPLPSAPSSCCPTAASCTSSRGTTRSTRSSRGSLSDRGSAERSPTS